LICTLTRLCPISSQVSVVQLDPASDLPPLERNSKSKNKSSRPHSSATASVEPSKRKTATIAELTESDRFGILLMKGNPLLAPGATDAIEFGLRVPNRAPGQVVFDLYISVLDSFSWVVQLRGRAVTIDLSSLSRALAAYDERTWLRSITGLPHAFWPSLSRMAPAIYAYQQAMCAQDGSSSVAYTHVVESHLRNKRRMSVTHKPSKSISSSDSHVAMSVGAAMTALVRAVEQTASASASDYMGRRSVPMPPGTEHLREDDLLPASESPQRLRVTANGASSPGGEAGLAAADGADILLVSLLQTHAPPTVLGPEVPPPLVFTDPVTPLVTRPHQLVRRTRGCVGACLRYFLCINFLFYLHSD
jgi:hypothetical protein